jgi:spore maturation protein CgeB
MVGIECRHTLEDFEGNPVRYSQAKMGLSISQTKDYWGYTSDRTYNIMATGCPVLIQEFKGMNEHGLVDGETCIAWSNLDEMMDKARYYKAHPKEREAIGQAGKEVLLARHTWNHRVEELFGLIARLGE